MFKADCPLVELGPMVGVLSVGVFLTDPSPSLSEFLRKPLMSSLLLGWVGLGCEIKANCQHVEVGPARGVASIEIFLRVYSPYLQEFRRKS